MKPLGSKARQHWLQKSRQTGEVKHLNIYLSYSFSQSDLRGHITFILFFISFDVSSGNGKLKDEKNKHLAFEIHISESAVHLELWQGYLFNIVTNERRKGVLVSMDYLSKMRSCVSLSILMHYMQILIKLKWHLSS